MLWTEVITSPRPNLNLHWTKSVGLNSCKSHGTCNHTDQHTCSVTVQQVDARSHDAVIVYDSKFYESLHIHICCDSLNIKMSSLSLFLDIRGLSGIYVQRSQKI